MKYALYSIIFVTTYLVGHGIVTWVVLSFCAETVADEEV